jgi:ATP-binding cassette subfamily B protein
VTLNGVPVTELSLARLRQAVSYAFERPELVGATVEEAIRYGRPDIGDAAVNSAARAARADAFIQRLPAGYQTLLADAPMSGGERQRLGLARALARPSIVYIFDDATSGLDTVTEAEVTATLTERLSGQTRLVVAHRVTTAARCDLVAWLDQGRVRALGGHEELWWDLDYRAIFATTERLAASHG